MSSLSSRDLEEIRALGGVATECRTEEDLRDELLRRIQATLKAPSGLFFHYSSDGAPGQFHGGFSLGVPEQAPESWRKQWRRKDPFVRHFLRHVAAGGEPVCVSSSVVSPRDYVRSEFYCDFLAPQSVYHILVAGLFRARHMVGVLGLHRPQEASAFSATDMLKVNLILPHFTAAVTNVGMQEQLAARQSIIDTLAQDLACSAVLMLDANLEVVMANHRALDLLGLRADPPPGGHALPAEVRSGCLKAREQLQAAGAAAGTQMDLVLR